MKLTYKEDKYGKKILCNDDESHQIMMEWEKIYMEKSIEILDPFGKILEVGFGMGYSARKICSYEAVKEYNVIECAPIVWEEFEKFKNQQQIIRPELKVNLIKGRWEDVLNTTSIFDCIYFDDYKLDEDPLTQHLSITRLVTFLIEVLKNNTKIGSKISYYTTTGSESFFKKVNCVDVKIIEFPVQIPDNCKYVNGNKMYIPVITKTSNAELDLKDKLIPANNANIQKINPEIEEQIQKEIERHTKYKTLFDDIQVRSPSCGLIVIDNFYNNPHETRKYILTQEFSVRGNYPGQRTVSYATQHLKDIIQGYVMPFGGKITDFPIPDKTTNANVYNGSFQYTTSRDRSWVHIDGFNNWGGVLYMTPNAPLSSGTAFYKFNDGAECQRDQDILENKTQTDTYSQDMTKWQLVDQVGNVFNRLILFNSKRFHMSMDYFGDSKENGRLFQVFFFSTEK